MIVDLQHLLNAGATMGRPTGESMAALLASTPLPRCWHSGVRLDSERYASD